MTDRTAPRVVLLARAGEARDRLGEALAQAGAEVALVADPTSGDPAEAAASQPQAVLVALEPALEDALERYDALLSDPAIAVIFEEADLAAQRTGWDSARWVRHLAAKLHRHQDVLPPGAEDEGDLHPSPGALPPLRADSGLDIAAFTDEAQARAGDVPRDEGLEPEVRLEADAGEGLPLADDASAEMPEPESNYGLAGGLRLDADTDIASEDNTGDLPVEAEAGSGIEADFDLSGLSADTLTFEAVADDDLPPSADGDGGALDAGGLEPGSWKAGGSAGADAGLVDVDELLASLEAGDAGDDEDLPGPRPGDSPAAPSGATSEAPPAPRPAAEVDLDALEARVSSLSLVDVDSYGHGPERGAVLVEGGLGGPDAVRQLLAAIPEGFPRPVLVRLQLDGGRYDRLVKQMARAARIPVALAEAGNAAEAGTAYFIPPDIALQRDRGRLAFVADEGRSQPLLDALPPGDSALLLLSGSGAESVDAGMARVAAGLLVAGQALDGCYDPAASNALIARGATTAPPAELAEQLAARWPS